MRFYATVGATSMVAALLTAFALISWSGSAVRDHGNDAVDPIVSGAIPIDDLTGISEDNWVRFTVSNLDRDTVCMVERAVEIDRRTRDFIADFDCDTVWPGLASARNWIENDDGSVTLTDEHGAQLLVIGETRGFDFATMEPSGVDITWLQIP